MAIRLSVNINKVATLRNSRGGNLPDVRGVAGDCQKFGADGITVHPRPDERHIRYSDVRELRPLIYTEFNIEGNPQVKKFVDLVLEVRPEQVTLVPDEPDQITSNHGWDTRKHRDYLREMVSVFQQAGIRVSLFADPIPEMVEGAAETGADRVELYTEAYANEYESDKYQAIKAYLSAARKAEQLGLGLNAGHDLNRKNLSFFAQNIPQLLEVSIGHALISDSLYFGLENTIQMYKRALSV